MSEAAERRLRIVAMALASRPGTLAPTDGTRSRAIGSSTISSSSDSFESVNFFNSSRSSAYPRLALRRRSSSTGSPRTGPLRPLRSVGLLIGAVNRWPPQRTPEGPTRNGPPPSSPGAPARTRSTRRASRCPEAFEPFVEDAAREAGVGEGPRADEARSSPGRQAGGPGTGPPRSDRDRGKHRAQPERGPLVHGEDSETQQLLPRRVLLDREQEPAPAKRASPDFRSQGSNSPPTRAIAPA